jgi:hypothetical protein
MNSIDFSNQVIDTRMASQFIDGKPLTYGQILADAIGIDAGEIKPRKVPGLVEKLATFGTIEMDDSDLADLEKMVSESKNLSSLIKGCILIAIDKARK